MKYIKYLVLVLMLMAPIAAIQPCKAQSMEQRERQIQREKKRRQRDDMVLYQKALKNHMKSQTPETRVAMKQAMRTAKQNREHRREFFVKRWFRNWFGYKQKQNKG